MSLAFDIQSDINNKSQSIRRGNNYSFKFKLSLRVLIV